MTDESTEQKPAQSMRFLTLQQVCEELNVQRTTAMWLIKSRELAAIQVGGRGQWRIERAKLEEYIATAYERARADIARAGLESDPGLE